MLWAATSATDTISPDFPPWAVRGFAYREGLSRGAVAAVSGRVGALFTTPRGKEANSGGVEAIDGHHGWRGGWLVTYDTWARDL